MAPDLATNSLLSANLSLQGKSAVVTGASTGIGRAIAVQLAASGADVFLHARSNASDLAITARAAGNFGIASETILYDLSADLPPRGKAYLPLVDAAYAWRSAIDIWVNNAGADVLTDEMKESSFEDKLQQLWQVDVRATIGLSRAVGQRMRSGSPEPGSKCIVNIGWDQALTGMGGDSGEMFAATKAAVIGFTRSLAKSLAPTVRVNCVAPGWIKTDWGRSASPAWDQRARHESLLGRWGHPEDVAQAVAFLVSPAARFMNAQVIEVNGGPRGAEPLP